jgi:hypothetical protein
MGLRRAANPSMAPPVQADLSKLISEYCAIEKMDRLSFSPDPTNETELAGFRVREMMRWQILLELTTWITVAEELMKP